MIIKITTYKKDARVKNVKIVDEPSITYLSEDGKRLDIREVMVDVEKLVGTVRPFNHIMEYELKNIRKVKIKIFTYKGKDIKLTFNIQDETV